MRSLRRSRWLRLFAVLGAVLAPGTGGAWLQVAHPCAVAAPWLAERAVEAEPGQDPSGAHAGHHAAQPSIAHDAGLDAAAATHADDGRHHRAGAASPPTDDAPAPGHGPHDGTCQCIGSCLSASAALAADGTPDLPLIADASPSSSGFAAVHARLAARLRELLPPATAPPVA